MGKKKVVATNKKAYRDYHIEERYEAGLVLKGAEVKSVRAGQVSLVDSYAQLRDSELYLYNVHISPYAHSRNANYDPYRARKLL
ncbi:MAG: SsrA-binding protein, partial [Terriglobia bacterium]